MILIRIINLITIKKQNKVNSMQIKLDNSKKAILIIDSEFVVREDKDKLKIYPNEEVSLGTGH
jgi:hypothetical protein